MSGPRAGGCSLCRGGQRGLRGGCVCGGGVSRGVRARSAGRPGVPRRPYGMTADHSRRPSCSGRARSSGSCRLSGGTCSRADAVKQATERPA